MVKQNSKRYSYAVLRTMQGFQNLYVPCIFLCVLASALSWNTQGYGQQDPTSEAFSGSGKTEIRQPEAEQGNENFVTQDDDGTAPPPPPSFSQQFEPPAPASQRIVVPPSIPSQPKSSETKAKSAATGTNPPASRIPRGQELVKIDFPELTELRDIIKAVGQWTGKNFILPKEIAGVKVSIISPQEVTKEEAYQAFLSALNVAGFTVVETGKVVKIVQIAQARNKNIKTIYGATWAPQTDEVINQIIPLNYLSATDLANQIRNLGFATNIAPFTPTNSIIISDTGHKIRRILEIIRLLDVKSNQPQIAIETIKYNDVNEIVRRITDLFSPRAGNPYVHKISADTRTNSIILVGPAKGLDDVVRVIRRMDKPISDSQLQTQIRIRPLEYADATKVAETLQNLALNTRNNARTRTPTQPAQPIPQQPAAPAPQAGAAAPVANVTADLGEVRITADKPTNSLIIQGTASAYQELETIIQALDKRRDQVYIEADIVDLSVDNGMNMQMSLLAGATAANKRINIPFGFNPMGVAPLAIQDSTLDSKTRMAALGPVLSNNAILGILSGQKINIGGLEISPGAMLLAIKTDANNNVLQTPSLLVANNEKAVFSSTERKMRLVKTQTQTGTAENYQPFDAVVSLDIQPQITKSDMINLDIKLKSEVFTKSDFDSTNLDRQVRDAATKITVANQQTVVISGMQRETDEEVRSKVPLLGDIPILGWLFRKTERNKRRSNLAIFITPYIVRGPEDLAKIYQKKMQERDEFLKLFYGKNYMQQKDIFSRIPGPEQGKAPQTPISAIEAQPASPHPATSANADNKNKSLNSTTNANEEEILPSQDPEPITAPNTGWSGGGFIDPASIPPPPPPPPGP